MYNCNLIIWKQSFNNRAYEISISHTYQLRNSPILVTIGNDEPGVNPLIKVWDTSRLDKNNSPFCYRVTRALADNRPVQVSVLAVHDSSQFMAIGFVDGSLVLYRGDITRDRSSKQKCLKISSNAKSEITGLAFKISGNKSFLFVATDRAVIVFDITYKDKEQQCPLDNIGCNKRCTVLAESMQENHFMVARKDAVYCYTSDGRGPCYAIEGEKIMLEWFRSYLIIISKSNRLGYANSSTGTGTPASQEDLITVLDIYNKFIVFSGILPNINAVFSEWGSFFIIDQDSNVYHLNENDLQSKLSLLFKKNLYDIAIRIAKSQQYDSDGLVDIFKQYGDHLCEKGDYSGAIEQYIKTIGKLEPSFVIRTFLDTQHLDKLTMYLQALHRQGQATEDHTTLLLNCYTKLNNSSGEMNSLKEFILSKDADLNYDVDVAIKVCRHGSPAEALMLAKKREKHDWYIKIQIEDNQKYSEVLEYISNLNFEEAEHYMKKYGKVLVENIPVESTQFLKRLCTNYKPDNSPIISENAIAGNFDVIQKADPEDFIPLFLNKSERLVEFLEHLISEECVLSMPVYDTLLEHYLHVWSKLEGISDKNKYAHKTLKLLQNPDIKYDKSQALVVCHMHSFSEGILYLYEEQKLYQQILRYHLSKNDSNSVLACCRRFGHQEPTLWVQVLWSCVRDNKQPSIELLNEVLTVIAKEKLFSPQLVIDAVGTGNAEITLGHIRSYIMNEFQQENKKINETSELTNNYQRDTDKLKEQLDALKSGVTFITSSRCAACHHPLELPTIHFLCSHSFHQHCFQTFSDDDNECITCRPKNISLRELLEAREYNKDLHETFHSQLEKAQDGFSVAAEYFGRGVFYNFKVLRDETVEKTLGLTSFIDTKTQPKSSPKLDQNYKNYGPGAEARIRQSENTNSQISLDSVSEARIRLQESRYGSSVTSTSSNKSAQLKIKKYEQKNGASKKATASVNPFEVDIYDEKKNPFHSDDELDETNPFREDYNCDKNLNPFN
ncbi:vacuolar protein sorting 11 isoform X2 [Rhynchophorus ferrugineus]|uniref:vacuolar protein sorting 11 isoform X2 n=1 Tax=Rhynchophorus ferrugineus TaxID=354439 RepID=UPI003FCDB91D